MTANTQATKREDLVNEDMFLPAWPELDDDEDDDPTQNAEFLAAAFAAIAGSNVIREEST